MGGVWISILNRRPLQVVAGPLAGEAGKDRCMKSHDTLLHVPRFLGMIGSAAAHNKLHRCRRRWSEVAPFGKDFRGARHGECVENQDGIDHCSVYKIHEKEIVSISCSGESRGAEPLPRCLGVRYP